MKKKESLMICELCKRNSFLRPTKLCDLCDLTIFQIDNILSLYLAKESPPIWLTDGLIEIASWIYTGNPQGSGYFNTANELFEVFAIKREEIIPIKELREFNYTNIPEKTILNALKDARIIDYNTEVITPGLLTKKLIQLRWEGYELDSHEVSQKLKEAQGIIAMAITRSSLGSHKKPQKALGIMRLMSKIILDNFTAEKIESTISDYDIEIAFNKMPIRQQKKILRQIYGLSDGDTKIIKDTDIEGNMPLKASVLLYLENMRERYRERDRSDRGYMAWW